MNWQPKYVSAQFGSGVSIPTRRQFSKLLLGSGLLTNSELWPAFAQSNPSGPAAAPDCDLLIKGGTVIDPSQKLHAPLDVAVKDGKILEIAADIPVSRARKAVSAKGTIVTPGLIDVHVHIYEGVGSLGVNADHFCLA